MGMGDIYENLKMTRKADKAVLKERDQEKERFGRELVNASCTGSAEAERATRKMRIWKVREISRSAARAWTTLEK